LKAAVDGELKVVGAFEVWPSPGRIDSARIDREMGIERKKHTHTHTQRERERERGKYTREHLPCVRYITSKRSDDERH
jgi:hypothetical protein